MPSLRLVAAQKHDGSLRARVVRGGRKRGVDPIGGVKMVRLGRALALVKAEEPPLETADLQHDL